MIARLRHGRAVPIAITVLLLAIGMLRLPGGTARGFLRSARSPELNRADREANAGGYYEELISNTGGSEAARDEMSLQLHGKPPEWVTFHDIKALRPLRGQFLQFELKPNVDREVFGSRFTTNRQGLRDRPYRLEKRPGTFRIVLLGSSIDMGWGVGTDETYENLFEDWLNAHAARRGLKRRFEVLNFAVAAYGPLQRLESFERKAMRFEPDMVLYSATMLDTRLLEIHICNLLHGRVPLKYDFLREALDDAGITTDERRLDIRGELAHKDIIKSKLKPVLWSLDDATLGALVADARSHGINVAVMILPRVGQGDTPEARAAPVARHAAIASRYSLPLLDLMPTFDNADPAELEIGRGDDHPNARGHHLLFLALARAIVKDATLYQTLFEDRAGSAIRTQKATNAENVLPIDRSQGR
jgi:hypothetical protein